MYSTRPINRSDIASSTLIALPTLPDYLKPWVVEPMESSKQAQGTLINDLQAHPTSVDHSASASFDETSCRAIELGLTFTKIRERLLEARILGLVDGNLIGHGLPKMRFEFT